MALGGWQPVGMLEGCCRLLCWRKVDVGNAGQDRAAKRGGDSDHQGSKVIFTVMWWVDRGKYDVGK